MLIQEILKTVLWIITKESAHSRNSGNVIRVIQKFCNGPENLDQFFRSYRNAVQVPEIVDKLLWSIAKDSACSRNSGNCVLIRNERASFTIVRICIFTTDSSHES